MIDLDQSKVCILGLGYIGLPTAAVVAGSGLHVHGVDVASHVVETINEGNIHIEEIDLEALVRGVVQRGLLKASLEVEPADVFLIAVPTPFGEDRTPDISYVLEAATSIASSLKQGDLIVLESTSPVGTTEQIRDLVAKLRPDLRMPGIFAGIPDIAIAYCPERVLPGRIIEELVHNDRSIGGITPRCARKALAFYKRFVRGECVTTDARSAEMTKLVENAYRDVNIAFANELSMISDAMNLDVWEVIRLANRHPRVNVLQPGPGVGGHCIAVDPWFIIHSAPEHSRIIKMARVVNEGKVEHVIARARALIDAAPAHYRIACMGLAYKANIDDVRESPALKIAIDLALTFGQRMAVVEPYVRSLPTPLADTGVQLINVDEALETCDILLPLVDHDLFRAIPLAERATKIVYDIRGMWPDQPDMLPTFQNLKMAS